MNARHRLGSIVVGLGVAIVVLGGLMGLPGVDEAHSAQIRHRASNTSCPRQPKWTRVASLPESDGQNLTSDPRGGFWLTGTTGNSGANYGRLMLVKLRSSGKIQWTVELSRIWEAAANVTLSPRSDGSVWVAYWGAASPSQQTAGLLIVSPEGAVRHMPLPPGDSDIADISAREDGGAWIVGSLGPVDANGNAAYPRGNLTLASLSVDGTYTEYDSSGASSYGAGGPIWTMPDSSALFALGTYSSEPFGTVSPEGSVAVLPGVTSKTYRAGPTQSPDDGIWIATNSGTLERLSSPQTTRRFAVPASINALQFALMSNLTAWYIGIRGDPGTGPTVAGYVDSSGRAWTFAPPSAYSNDLSVAGSGAVWVTAWDESGGHQRTDVFTARGPNSANCF